MSRFLAIPAAALLAALVAVPAAKGGPPRDVNARVELEVAGLLPMGEGTVAVLVLREKGTKTLLPLIVPSQGPADGELRTPGLLRQAIEALGARVAEVEIVRAEESRASARVRIAQGARTLELRGRPSESVALAVSAGVPIVTSRRVLDESGITPDELAREGKKAREEAERL